MVDQDRPRILPLIGLRSKPVLVFAVRQFESRERGSFGCGHHGEDRAFSSTEDEALRFLPRRMRTLRPNSGGTWRHTAVKSPVHPAARSQVTAWPLQPPAAPTSTSSGEECCSPCSASSTS